MKFWKRALLASLLVLALAACDWTETPEAGQTAEPSAQVTAEPSDPAAAAPAEPETAEAPETGPADSTDLPETPEAVPEPAASVPETPQDETPETLPEDGAYTSRDDVALYLHLYGHLPDNFITKSEARNLGWNGGSLEPYAPGKNIGGDRFGNYEGLLPEGSYHECDIDTGGSGGRGAKRIVYSDDGRVYYTGDHYASFTLLYGEESP